MKIWFYEQAQAKGTTSFYESLTPDDVPVVYHKYFERKWRADEEAPYESFYLFGLSYIVL